MVKILGIKYGGHDTSASILINGKIVASCAQERYSKDKHSRKFPLEAIQDCLRIAKISINELNEISFVGETEPYFREMYLKPALKSKKRLDFLVSDIEKIGKILTVEEKIRKVLSFKGKIKFYPHHLCHLASSYYPSGFDKALCMSIDGVGEYQTDMIALGSKNKLEIIEESNVYPNSLGLLYSAITHYLGWKHHCDEGIIMGLAPYGNAHSKIKNLKQTYYQFFKKILIPESPIKFTVNLDYIDYFNSRDKWVTNKFIKIFGKKREYSDPITQHHKNIAAALQLFLEEFVLKKIKYLKKKYKSDYLCLSGGVALNCSMNGKIEKSKIFKKIYIQPASGDDGCSMGACFLGYKNYSSAKIKKNLNSYLGSSFSDKDIKNTIKKYNFKFIKSSNIFRDTAKYLNNGKIVSWFQGSAEFGPRALGNRSILCKPYPASMKDYLNKRVKFRENFRPFAPAVLDTFQSKYFSINQDSPHMLIACKVKSKYKDKIPAVVHIDNTCRVQTIKKDLNQKFYKLVKEFYNISRIPVVLNTSFNIKGQPIVNTPKEAIDTFLKTNIDVLAIGNYLAVKK
jgi:carbamoyltransferase